eukprot:2366145-Pyramimonas_sp.AAC.1
MKRDKLNLILSVYVDDFKWQDPQPTSNWDGISCDTVGSNSAHPHSVTINWDVVRIHGRCNRTSSTNV